MVCLDIHLRAHIQELVSTLSDLDVFLEMFGSDRLCQMLQVYLPLLKLIVPRILLSHGILA